MTYKTFEEEIDGYKVIFSDDPFYTKTDKLWERNLYQCYLIHDGYYSKCLISKQAYKDSEFKKRIPVILLREIRREKQNRITEP